jgi:hypothetical protein
MKAHADKLQENKRPSVASAVSLKQSSNDATFQFVDNRPEAVRQRNLQNMANNSPQAKRVAQLQLANGVYRAKKDSNVRDNDPPDYTKTHTLTEDLGVYVVDKGNRVSNFKAGWITNEHSWVKHDGEDDYDSFTGWIKDSNLKNDGKLLQDHFREGDKLYGRYQGRNKIRQSGRAANNAIRGARYNIIDDVNQEMMGQAPGKGSEEVERFRAYTAQNTKRPYTHNQDLINQYCKQALVHYTNNDHTIHFMLDGIAPAIVVRETKANRNREDFEYDGESYGNPRVTGIELRALMRAAMRAKGIQQAKTDHAGHDIDLTKVKFYLNNVQVAAPWAAKASSEWGRAWAAYVREKRG